MASPVTSSDSLTKPSSSGVGCVPDFANLTIQVRCGAVVLARHPFFNQKRRAAMMTSPVSPAPTAGGAAPSAADLIRQLVNAGYTPAVVTGTQRHMGTVSVCFGHEPVIDDLSVPVSDLLPIPSTLGQMHHLQLLARAFADAANEQGTKTAKQEDNTDEKKLFTSSSSGIVSRLDSIFREVVTSEINGGNEFVGSDVIAPQLIVVDQVCTSVEGIGVLRALVEVAATPGRVFGGSAAMKVVVVVSEPHLIAELRDCVDAISSSLIRVRHDSSDDASLQRLRLPCSVAPLGATEGAPGRKSASATAVALSSVWVVSAADVLHCLTSGADSPIAASLLPQPSTHRSQPSVVLVAGDAKVSTDMAIAETEAAWGPMHVKRILVDDAKLRTHASLRCSPVARLVVPLSLQQIRAVANFARNATSESLIASLNVPELKACSQADGRRSQQHTSTSSRNGADVPPFVLDARYYAIHTVVVEERRQCYGAGPGRARQGVKLALVVPSAFYDGLGVQRIVGLPIIELDLGSSGRAEVNARLREWRIYNDAALLVRLPPANPSVSDATSSLAFALSLVSTCTACIAVGSHAEVVATRWMEGATLALGDTLDDRRFYVVTMDLDDPLEGAATAAAATSNSAVARTSLLGLTVSRVWDADVALRSESQQLHRRFYEGAAATPAPTVSGVVTKGLKKKHRAEVVDGLPRLTDLADYEHPLEAHVRIVCVASQIAPTSVGDLCPSADDDTAA